MKCRAGIPEVMGRTVDRTKGLRASAPWWMRIGAKLILSRLPVSGRAWQRIGLFSPGGMLNAEYAITMFDRHYQAAGAPSVGFQFLELGPGDSLASAVIGRAYGAAKCWLIESGAYVSRDMAVYRRLIAELESQEMPGTRLQDLQFDTLEELLTSCGAEYLEHGLESLARVPDAGCDFVFSQAVLEHLPRAEFGAFAREMFRVLKPGGIASHAVDFRDHLGGGLSNLRFSAALWEAPWFARRSGFYTNRLRLSEMEKVFWQAGFEVEVLRSEAWSELPIRRAALDPAYRAYEDADLLVRSAFLRLRKP